jgi:hypothetical protein
LEIQAQVKDGSLHRPLKVFFDPLPCKKSQLGVLDAKEDRERPEKVKVMKSNAGGDLFGQAKPSP